MTRIPSWLMVIIAVALAVLGGRAISAQDKYPVQVPDGLAFGRTQPSQASLGRTTDSRGGVAPPVGTNCSTMSAIGT